MSTLVIRLDAFSQDLWTLQMATAHIFLQVSSLVILITLRIKICPLTISHLIWPGIKLSTYIPGQIMDYRPTKTVNFGLNTAK